MPCTSTSYKYIILPAIYVCYQVTHPHKVGPMLDRRRRRLANIDTKLCGCLVLAGKHILPMNKCVRLRAYEVRVHSKVSYLHRE